MLFRSKYINDDNKPKIKSVRRKLKKLLGGDFAPKKKSDLVKMQADNIAKEMVGRVSVIDFAKKLSSNSPKK